jgi:rubrerythrin
MEKAVWSNAHMNDLPDSAFLYIESGGKKDESGKTVPRSLRHFPYRGMDGKIDLAHVRNAIARIPQSKCGLSEQQKVALQNRARKLLEGKKEMEKAMFYIDLEKAGQIYYGPKGGKYRDPSHKVPWSDKELQGGMTKEDSHIQNSVRKIHDSAVKGDFSEALKLFKEITGTYGNNKIKEVINKHSIPMSQGLKDALNSYKGRKDLINELQDRIDWKKREDWGKKEYAKQRLGKSMDEGTKILETFLKSTIEDNSLPVIGKGKEQGDQALDGKGKSSDTPGNGSTVPDRGVTKPSVKKLSEDDEVDEKNMKDHKKPIENTARKSLHIASQTHEYMAREVALRKAQLLKEDLVYIEPDEPIQKSIENRVMTSDEMAVRSMHDESFYKAHLLNRPLSGISLSTVSKCRHCSNTFSKAITVCPNCGRM